MSSEEASFRKLSIDNYNSDIKRIWHPKSGTAVIAELGKGLISNGIGEPKERNYATLLEAC